MDKAPEAFLTIGEMAGRLGVKTHILRYWEEQFPMLKPLTRAGGRRLYRPADLALLQQINDLLHRQGYTIKGARQFLGGGWCGGSGRGASDEQFASADNGICQPTPRDTQSAS